MEFEVKFNKAVNKASAENTANYRLSNAAVFANATLELQADNKTVKITTATIGEKITNNSTFLFEVKNVKDTDLNVMDDYSVAMTFKDDVKPTLSGVTYSTNTTAKVSFSEPMDQITTANVKVYDKDGVDVTVTTAGSTALGLTANTTAGDKDVVIALNGGTLDETYTVKIFGAKDVSGNLAGTQEFKVTKSEIDKVKPTIESITPKSLNTFEIKFSEAIQGIPASATFGKLQVNNATAVELVNTEASITSVVWDNDKLTLTVTLASPLTAGVNVISVNNYKDLSENEQTTATTKTLNFQADTTAPKFVSSQFKDGKLLVKFDDSDIALGSNDGTSGKEAILAGTRKLDNVEYSTIDWVSAAAVALYDPANTGKTDTIEITLPAGGIDNGNYTVKLATNVVTDQTGNANDETVITFAYNGTVASGKPVVVDDNNNVTDGIDAGVNFIVQAAGTPNEITLKFDREVTDATALNVNNYLVDGKVVFEKAIFSGNKQTVKLTLKQDVIKADADYPFTIKNVKGTNNEVMDTVTFNQGFKENIAPTLKSARVLEKDKIEVVFSKAMKAATITDNDDFELYIGGVKVEGAAVISGVTGSTDTYVLALTTPLTPADLLKTIEIKLLSTTDAVDANTIENAAVAGTITVTK